MKSADADRLAGSRQNSGAAPELRLSPSSTAERHIISK
jgi:hypothetical protein